MANAKLKTLIEEATERTLKKTSLSVGNVANRVAAHLRNRCPELCAIPGLWFSGSNVWAFLYGQEPDPNADLDVFMLQPKITVENCFDDPRRALCKQLGIADEDMELSKVKTGPDEDQYKEGIKALYKGGKLDIWEAVGTPQDALRDYPGRTHAHCRAAFSFADGLIVLPNEEAKEQR